MFARTMLRIGSGARLRVATLRSNVGVRRSLHRSPAMFRGIVPTQPNALAASAAEAAEAGGGAGGAVERYAGPLRWLHWIMGGGALSCIGLVLLAQDEGKKPKGEKDGKKIGFYMKLHKWCNEASGRNISIRLAAVMRPDKAKNEESMFSKVEIGQKN